MGPAAPATDKAGPPCKGKDNEGASGFLVIL